MKKFLSARNSESGFTLIELLVVVIIIAILAAIAVPVYIGIQNNAKKSAIQSDVATTKLNVAAFLSEDGTITAGTYSNTDGTNNGTSKTSAGGAQIQRSGSPADEVVAVTVAANGQFTVTGSSASLGGYSVTFDSATGQQGPTE